MNNPSILVVVVLYKCSLAQSQTWNSLASSKGLPGERIRVLVFNNSPTPLSDAEQNLINLFSHRSDYFHYPENISLAKIYNLAIKKRDKEDFLLILDQDSQFDTNFFNEFKIKSTIHPEIDLFIPYVIHNRKVVSPGNWLGYKGRYWKNLTTGKVDSKNLTAISSGMFIGFSYLTNDFSHFDETFSLYGIDTYFMQQYAKRRQYAFVLDYEAAEVEHGDA